MRFVVNSLRAMIASFDGDPPSSEYQRGYLQALLDLQKTVVGAN